MKDHLNKPCGGGVMTQFQALTKALHLALTAPDYARAAMAASLAESIAAGLTSAQVEAAKARALKLVPSLA